MEHIAKLQLDQNFLIFREFYSTPFFREQPANWLLPWTEDPPYKCTQTFDSNCHKIHIFIQIVIKFILCVVLVISNHPPKNEDRRSVLNIPYSSGPMLRCRIPSFHSLLCRSKISMRELAFDMSERCRVNRSFTVLYWFSECIIYYSISYVLL